MYVQIVHLRVKPDRVSEFLNVFRINYEGTRQEPGNVRFELLQSREKSNHFTVYEVFASEEALAAHRQTDHFKTVAGEFPALLETDRTIEVLSPVMAEYLPQSE